MMDPSSIGMPQDDTPAFLAAGGETGALMRSMDWASTPLGPTASWPQSLRTTVSTCLNSRFPMLIFWGPSLVKIYNDAYRQMLGDKHPLAMGAPAREVWPEIWHIIAPMLDRVMTFGEATWSENQRLLLERHGFTEETYFTFSYSPIRDETGQVAGVLDAAAETTRQVIGERRLRSLHAIAQRAASAASDEEACRRAAEALAEHRSDVPFALLYLLDAGGDRARLAAALGVAAGDELAPEAVALRPGPISPWPLGDVARSGIAQLVTDQSVHFGSLVLPDDVPTPRSALVLPVSRSADARPAGLLVAGISARIELDDNYRDYLQLVAGQIATAVLNARALEDAERRADALAALNQAKTAFFNNVSHELRTPLTLMIAPTEEALASPGQALSGNELQMVYRNELRLLKLVNTLLDFSRIEAGHAEAAPEPTDLAALTTEIANAFRFAIERSGIRYEIDCPPLPAPVYVDRAMWDNIVLNLLSNAFKFTFDGAIRVALRRAGDDVELEVTDTGAGIPQHELPHIFDRFHRVQGVRSRTHEGSGIGLALVRNLVGLHGGTVRVESEEGGGSTFTVSLPLRTALAGDAPAADVPAGAASRAAAPFLLEASSWAHTAGAAAEEPAEAAQVAAGYAAGETVLVVDDNADMREYVAGLLRRHWQVATAADGAEALAAIRRQAPDLVLTDVLMPNVDGFELLHTLRGDASTASIPVVMLSARAGEEARVEGLEAGADDYLIKPFGPREVVARVGAQLTLARNARERAALLQREQAAREEAELANRAKDDFLAMLGHELRNPLAPILTTLQLMRLRGSGELEKERATIERQADQLVRLIDDLLDISRIRRGKIDLKRQKIEPADVVAKAIEIVAPLVERRSHHLTVNVPRTGLMVEGDMARLVQVVTNLLTNAAKYTESGGSIGVVGERIGDEVVLRVSDSGIGIEPKFLPNVFDMFTQGRQSIDRLNGGLGLGLAIVRSLVTAHGGRVGVHSEGKGRGSEFTVRLPASDAESVAAECADGLAPERAPTASATRQQRILVVDDNEDAAESLAQYMQAMGHHARVARDGPAALRIAAELEPDVALIDIGLPIMDGYELARLLQEEPRAAGVRLIAVTGYGQPSDRRRTREAGFVAHMVKPVDLRRLLELLDGDAADV
ncbi:MAG: response regulator [Gammaproteobacteria bacterium]|nr:response regulator [Gammaproteobacteria bacterium]